MKYIYILLAMILSIVSVKAQTLTFMGVKRGVYNNRMYLMSLSPHYKSNIVLTKDTVTYSDSLNRKRYVVKSINSENKHGKPIYSYLCNNNTVVILDINRNYVTIQQPDTIRVYSGAGAVITKFSRNK